jgi:hypothetical protein
MRFSPYALSMNHEPSTIHVLPPAARFTQNKPNLLAAQTNVTSVITMNYEPRTMNDANKNKPNQTQSAGPSNERNFCSNKELRTNNYERSQQKQTQSNPISWTLE